MHAFALVPWRSFLMYTSVIETVERLEERLDELVESVRGEEIEATRIHISYLGPSASIITLGLHMLSCYGCR